MSFGTKIYTWLKGNLVGEDNKGNQYFCNSKDFKDLKAKRWVMFKYEIEASNIPPHWHAWLHKSIKDPPINYSPKYKWQKDHEPNKTGTKFVSSTANNLNIGQKLTIPKIKTPSKASSCTLVL